jgi:4-amino-4-deoxy-L-arabinose transferase-like glycosyltransferase
VRKWFSVRVSLLLLLLLSAFVRFCGLDWDGGIGAHPDERYMVGLTEGLRWPDCLNPFGVSPDFAYGHLPMYSLALLRLPGPGADLLFMGRALAALFDLGTVALTFALGRQIWGKRVGLLAAAFVGLMILHVQQAHFYTVDTPLAFFTVGALLFAVRLAKWGRSRDAWLAGVWAGLAVGSKFSVALLALPLGAACIAAPVRPGLRWRCTLRVGLGALLAFALTNPFALLVFPTFWRNVAREAAVARGLLDVPYTRQFRATWPYVYSLLQLLRWGMGWSLGLAAFGGGFYAVWRAVRRPVAAGEWVLVAWMLPFFALIGALYAKFPRYWLPATPGLAIYAAWLLLNFYRRSRRLTSILICLSLVYCLLFCLAFVTVYRSPHPWVAASTWIRQNVPPGAVIAVEQWDHPLPVGAAGEYDGVYDVSELPVFDENSVAKREAMEAILAEADVVIVASRRGYGTLARWSERYPLTARYYRQLFAGDLGFEPVACFELYPRLGPLALRDDPTVGLDFSLPDVCRSDAFLHLGRLDESFVVYDHPLVIIFRR